MKTRALACVAALALSACQSVQGRDYAGGVRRAAVDASYVDDSLEDDSGNEIESTTLRAGGSLGYFLNSRVELGADASFADQEQEILGVSTESDLITFGGFATYHFMSTGTVRPFLSAGLGLLTGSAGAIDLDGYYYGVEAGIATFVTESTSIDFGISKLWSIQDWDSSGAPSIDVDQDRLALTVGVSFLF